MRRQMRKLDVYLAGLEKEGLEVPSQSDRRQPNFRRISTNSGIEYKFLTAGAGKKRIILAVKQIGLDTTPDSAKTRQLKYEENLRHIGVYLQWLQTHGHKLPQDPTRGGRVFFAQVEVEAGLQRNTLIVRRGGSDTSHRSKLREIIVSAVPRLGIETRVLPQAMRQEEDVITYELLLKKGTEQRKRELEKKPSAYQQLCNTRSTLKRFYKVLCLDADAPVGPEFVIDFSTNIEQALATYKILSSRRKFQTEIWWWFDFYQKLIKEASMPEDFHQAFVRLVDRSGLNLSVLRRLIGTSFPSIVAWYRGTKTPRAKSLGAISRMESLCKLQAGTLVNKISCRLQRRVTASQLPESLRKNLLHARKVCPHLPDNFLELPLERQELIFESVSNEIIRRSDPYAQKLSELQRLQYRLIDWPATSEREFEKLAAFKTAERPPLGMKREGRWRATTKEMMRFQFGFLFGALSLPSDAEDKRLRGLGIPTSQLTLALLVCPLIFDWYVRFKRERRDGSASIAVMLLRNITPLLKDKTGWLRQKPELATRLQPVSDGPHKLISPKLVARARKDWAGVCDEAVEYYEQLLKELKPLATQARNPFLPIEGIIDMDNPMEVFSFLISEMKSDMPNRNTQPVFYHVAVRNCAIILLIAATGLRRNTVVQLDYTGDTSGHLTLRGDRFELNIPRHFFKEENSPFFGPKDAQVDYFMALPDVFGFNEIISEYLEVSRPFLLNRYYPNHEESPLFVNSRCGKSPRMSPTLVSEVYREATRHYLVENKWRGTGIPNVMPHGPHSARHLRGTTSMILTGSFQIAADANHQSVRMARKHYARYATKHRNRHVNKALFNIDD